MCRKLGYFGRFFSSVCSRPDGGGESVGDVGSGVVFAHGGHAAGVELVGDVVELAQVSIDLFGIVSPFKVGEPVQLIAQRPEEDAGVVVVLGDLLAEEAFGVGFPGGFSFTSPAPGEFVPDD